MRRLSEIAGRECRRLMKNPIYGFCMVVFPMLMLFYFTSLMDEGQPTDMPVGVVDNDHTATTRKLSLMLDAFQNSKVVAHYPSVAEARKAMQRNEIYAFIHYPKGMTEQMIAGRQPHLSFYYSMTSLTSGALLFKDLKTVSTLGMAGVGQATMRAKGLTDRQITTLLQPITIDSHQLSNPWINYNMYLSVMLVPGVIMLFILLLTPYSIGTEMKFGSGRQWLALADDNMAIALMGKLLPQTMVFLLVFWGYSYYVYGILQFPHPGGWPTLLLLALLSVVAAQGFGAFVFSLMPSLRMSMSVCSLWGVLSFSMVGTAFPVSAMDAPLQLISWLFPLRHYFVVYQMNVLNDYPLIYSWPHLLSLLIFSLLPWLLLRRLKVSINEYVYLP